jgi:uncharacterized MAPEG superfamily protein
MTTPLLCLVLYAAWAMVLVTIVATWRVFQVATKQKAPNEFPSGTPHGTDVYWRVNRAHINAVENLPIFASVVIATQLAGVAGDWLDTACIIIVIARVAQSLIHISSSTSVAVNLRFTAFLTQLGGLAYLIVRLVF